MTYQHLLDTEFLNQLYEHKSRVIYARLVALTYDEKPIEMIEGQVSSGSINVDGASSLRRTCSLTINTPTRSWHNYYWGVKSKFKLEVGLENPFKDLYEDIVWFPQGIYIITGFNTTNAANNYSISISGKDKMCMLNGDMGGALPNSIDFGVLEEVITQSREVDKKVIVQEVNDKNEIVEVEKIEKVMEDYDIITYHQVLIKNIIREALHTYANEPYSNIIINDLNEAAVELLEYRGGEETPMYLLYNTATNLYDNITLNGDMPCRTSTGLSTIISKIEKYMTRIDIVDNEATEIYLDGSNTKYTVAKVNYGDTIGYRPTDLTYAGNLISSIGEALTSILDKIVNMLGEYEYFYNVYGQFIFQKKNTYLSTKWSGRVETNEIDYYDLSENGDLEYIFDNHELITSLSSSPSLNSLKNNFIVWGQRTTSAGTDVPIHYRYAIDIKPQTYENYAGIIYSASEVDWRELIYQMAVDYFAHHDEEVYWNWLTKQYPKGKTGYEQYYTDMLGFWRELYDGNNWTELVIKNPSQLTFWIDFMDVEGAELEDYAVPLIGERTKVLNDKDVTGIYFKEVPNLIFVKQAEWEQLDKSKYSGYIPVYILDNLDSLITISSQKKSAKDVIDELLYQHTYCAENITIQCAPIYHLNPNTRIRVVDEENGIGTNYIMSKFTIPLTYNGMMSITATKAPERLI